MRLAAPASKSVTNRALLCAALAEGTSHLRGAAASDDAEAMTTALGQLGARVEPRPGSLDRDGDRRAAGRPGPAAGRAAVRDDHAVPGRGGHPDPGRGDRDRGAATAPAPGGPAGGGPAGAGGRGRRRRGWAAAGDRGRGRPRGRPGDRRRRRLQPVRQRRAAGRPVRPPAGDADRRAPRGGRLRGADRGRDARVRGRRRPGRPGRLAGRARPLPGGRPGGRVRRQRRRPPVRAGRGHRRGGDGDQRRPRGPCSPTPRCRGCWRRWGRP